MKKNEKSDSDLFFVFLFYPHLCKYIKIVQLYDNMMLLPHLQHTHNQ